MTYYSVKLNVPPDKADAIKALVPAGEPVSGTLISILLGVAADRGIDVSGATYGTDAAWHRRIDRLDARIKKMESRLDAALSGRLLG